MNNYIKPTIRLAANASSRSSISSCDTTATDMELIQSIIGGADADQVFNSNEDCRIAVELDMYCKFTSAETGAIQIFWS